MDAILGLLTSGGLSGIVGLVGGLFQRAQDIKLKKMEFDLKRVEFGYRLKELKMETESSLRIMKEQGEMDLARDLAEMEQEQIKEEGRSHRAALAADKASYSSKGMSAFHPLVLVDTARGFIRPVITMWMLFLMTYISIKIGVVANIGEFSAVDRLALTMQIIEAIISLTFLVCSFWFGSRSKRR